MSSLIWVILVLQLLEANLYLFYVEDVDQVFVSAIKAGGIETVSVQDQFDGDRRGTLTDPFGHIWLVATRKEDVAPDELIRRFEEMLKQRKHNNLVGADWQD